MDIDYTVLDPTGNITIFVDTCVPEALHAAVAAALLEAEPTAEQVGFITREPGCDISVRMAGGEFCGNACMAAGALFVHRGGSPGSVIVKMSGCDLPVMVEITPQIFGYSGRVSMPAPVCVSRVMLPLAGTELSLPLVDFGGIAHLVDTQGMLRGDISKDTISLWCSLLHSAALGVMRYDPVFSSLEPLVYVPAVNTLYHERSCGSGTSALGVILARERGAAVSVPVREPGGTLTVDASTAGELWLSGRVNILSSKSLQFHTNDI